MTINSWRVPIAAALFVANTFIHVSLLLVVALLKALLPNRAIRGIFNRVLTTIAERWIGFNTWTIRALTQTRLIGELPVTLRSDGRYLVLANHQSWVDIPVLQAILNRRIPLLRFFLKSELLYVPLLGLAWWALDFPFMKRYSRQTLARHPELAGRDIAATRRACAKFKEIPVSVMNFVEGTRFTPRKHEQQASAFAHLLKPKAGAVAFVLDAMGGALQAVLDITIVYPRGRPTFADLFANRVPEVRVTVIQRPIPPELLGGDYASDPALRVRVQRWLNEIWTEKDATIEQSQGRATDATVC
jgi:1-acyl-sn-glycerol-3-phosphate acyltransferase